VVRADGTATLLERADGSTSRFDVPFGR
jgi:hypothetical protein